MTILWRRGGHSSKHLSSSIINNYRPNIDSSRTRSWWNGIPWSAGRDETGLTDHGSWSVLVPRINVYKEWLNLCHLNCHLPAVMANPVCNSHMHWKSKCASSWHLSKCSWFQALYLPCFHVSVLWPDYSIVFATICHREAGPNICLSFSNSHPDGRFLQSHWTTLYARPDSRWKPKRKQSDVNKNTAYRWHVWNRCKG